MIESKIGKLMSIYVPSSVDKGEYLFVRCLWQSGQGKYRGTIASVPSLGSKVNQYELIEFAEIDILTVYDYS